MNTDKKTPRALNWDISDEDQILIRAIGDRIDKANKAEEIGDRQGYEMYLTAAHLNGCPLDLGRLLKADDFNFWHDLSGIRAHLNISTGEFEKLFPSSVLQAEGRVMARLFKTDGTEREVQPENGVSFELKEVYKLLEIDYVEVVRLTDDYILLCDEEGKLKQAPQFNQTATKLYQMHYGPVDAIFGNVILCYDKEFR